MIRLSRPSVLGRVFVTASVPYPALRLGSAEPKRMVGCQGRKVGRATAGLLAAGILGLHGREVRAQGHPADASWRLWERRPDREVYHLYRETDGDASWIQVMDRASGRREVVQVAAQCAQGHYAIRAHSLSGTGAELSAVQAANGLVLVRPADLQRILCPEVVVSAPIRIVSYGSQGAEHGPGTETGHAWTGEAASLAARAAVANVPSSRTETWAAGLSSPSWHARRAGATTHRTRAASPWTEGRGYTNSRGAQVDSPRHAFSAPRGSTAQCGDGTWSFSQSRSGTCSHHGGVAHWRF